MSLLDVRALSVSFPTADGVVHAVRDLSLTVQARQTLGIVGESGSGKSVSMQTIIGLTRGARVTGEAWFDGRDLLQASSTELRGVRGGQIGMIFQDALASLHPYYRVGWQIVELLREHERTLSRSAARRRATDLLALVGIPNATRRLDDYPHQFSGGMRQRVMIAMAMAMNPKLLIADEPTTALDVTVQAQVLRVMADLQREFGTAIIMITHDLGVVADIADEVVVMYAGSVMETASRRELFYDFHHPYTEGLLRSLPMPGERRRLTPIPGQPPSLITLPSGCPFHPRCRYSFDQCVQQSPPLREVTPTQRHRSACWLPTAAVDRAARHGDLDAGPSAPGPSAPGPDGNAFR
ncbi:MAG TPA: ABC transporter ATP-binding protein [Propionibacteriaceae bacterium]|nr:ABC transporter ATP-binding protein [Propionibacteriaceae bacterium]